MFTVTSRRCGVVSVVAGGSGETRKICSASRLNHAFNQISMKIGQFHGVPRLRPCAPFPASMASSQFCWPQSCDAFQIYSITLFPQSSLFPGSFSIQLVVVDKAKSMPTVFDCEL